jgi:cyclopropane fatty-acyl-phospholipid synthase-like methyltransferase
MMASSNYEKTKAAPHPGDISAADLQVAMAAQGNVNLLSHLVELSRGAFGFYPSHFPYTINYPWVSERLEHLSKGSRVLDIGAGVSPVPLFLAEKGVLVDCVDNSRCIRTLPFSADWNEWGFLDYGALNQNLAAHHCDITEFSPTTTFEAIYSIAALAHMPRATREQTLHRCYEWLQPGGMLLLTLDVIPSSDFLWNRSEGREIESPVQHGTIDSVLEQLKRLGFRINEFRTKRAVYKARTDLLFIACSKESKSSS